MLHRNWRCGLHGVINLTMRLFASMINIYSAVAQLPMGWSMEDKGILLFENLGGRLVDSAQHRTYNTFTYWRHTQIAQKYDTQRLRIGTKG